MNQQFSRQGTTAKFVLWDDRPSATAQPSFVVQPLQPIVFTDTTIGKQIFSGVVTKPHLERPSPTLNVWSLDCIDYTYFADSVIVAGDYLGWTADAIIKDLVSRFPCGLTTSNVSPGPVIPRYQANYLPLSTVLANLAQLSSQSTDYGWYVDGSRDIHFFSLAQVAAPAVTFSDGTPSAQFTQSTGGIVSLDYEWDGTQIRNSCIVRGSTYRATFTDTFVGNGQTASFVLSYPVYSAATPAVSVSSAPQTVTVNTSGSAASAPTTQWVVTQNAVGVWVLQTGTAATPAAGQTLRVTYTYQAPVIARVDDTASQAAYNGSNNGLYQMYVADQSILTLATAQQRAQAELTQYSRALERAQFTTDEAWPGHIAAGQQVTLNANTVPDSQNSWQTPLAATLLVTSLRIAGSVGGYRRYDVTGVRTA